MTNATTTTVQAHKVDLVLLRTQAGHLANIQTYLTSGEPCASADDWHDALEGILNLLAALKPSSTSAIVTELIDVLEDNETAWSGEEDSVQTEHRALIKRTRAVLKRAQAEVK